MKWNQRQNTSPLNPLSSLKSCYWISRNPWNWMGCGTGGKLSGIQWTWNKCKILNSDKNSCTYQQSCYHKSHPNKLNWHLDSTVRQKFRTHQKSIHSKKVNTSHSKPLLKIKGTTKYLQGCYTGWQLSSNSTFRFALPLLSKKGGFRFIWWWWEPKFCTVSSCCCLEVNPKNLFLLISSTKSEVPSPPSWYSVTQL